MPDHVEAIIVIAPLPALVGYFAQNAPVGLSTIAGSGIPEQPAFPNRRPQKDSAMAQLLRHLETEMFTFTRGSTGTYFNKAGLLVTAAINAIRNDFDPVTGARRGYLLESDRTNLFLRSQELDLAPWAITGASVVANVANLTTATLLSGDGGCTDVGGGWRYVWQNFTSITAGAGSFRIRLSNGTANSYTGDSTSGVLLWGGAAGSVRGLELVLDPDWQVSSIRKNCFPFAFLDNGFTGALTRSKRRYRRRLRSRCRDPSDRRHPAKVQAKHPDNQCRRSHSKALGRDGEQGRRRKAG